MIAIIISLVIIVIYFIVIKSRKNNFNLQNSHYQKELKIFEDEIKTFYEDMSYKKDNLLQYIKNNFDEETYNNVIDKKLQVGMSKHLIRYFYGSPDYISKTENAFTVWETFHFEEINGVRRNDRIEDKYNFNVFVENDLITNWRRTTK